jgi:hypothetical protein
MLMLGQLAVDRQMNMICAVLNDMIDATCMLWTASCSLLVHLIPLVVS